MTQSRLASPVVWTSIAAQVFSILLLTGVVTPAQVDTYNQIIGAVLQILVLVGVFNNPTDKENW